MLPDADAAIHAIAGALAKREGEGREGEGREGGAEARAEHAAAYVRATCARAPGYIRPPLRLATWGFDAWGCLRHRRPFHALTPEQQIAQLERWEGSWLGPARMLMTFYVGVTLFALHEQEAAA
ncbi:MAG TPA: hypothetical protein VF475_05455 [Sphingobium sp.]